MEIPKENLGKMAPSSEIAIAPRKVLVLSAFGRCHSLAADLKNKGFEVELVDVTESLGRWAPEDWEGPFGLFKWEGLTSSQLARLEAEDYSEAVEKGFVFLFPDGPLEMKGPLFSHRWRNLGFSENAKNFVTRFHIASDSEKAKMKEALTRESYDQNWVVGLMNQLSSPIFIRNDAALSEGEPMPVFAPMMLRRTSRKGLGDGLKWVQSLGITVHAPAIIKDIRLDGKSCSGVEIEATWSGALQGQVVVWGLTSEETFRVQPSVGKKLFPEGFASPTWMWMRYRLQLNSAAPLSVLPAHFVMVQDPCLPWTHANLMILQRTVQSPSYDIWIRIPTEQRFHRTYLESQGDAIIAALAKRIPKSDPQRVDMPQDHLYEYQELGPPRFPVFTLKELNKLNMQKNRNVFFHSPEVWKGMDWAGQFRGQNQLFKNIENWFAKNAKERPLRDRQIHPS